jgi:hypothetical protein
LKAETSSLKFEVTGVRTQRVGLDIRSGTLHIIK